MSSIAKKKTLDQKVEKKLLSSFQKTKSTQLRRSVFADKIEQVKKTKFELELIKLIVDCFTDSHGFYTNKLVSLKTKSLLNNHFVNSKEVFINQLIVQMIS